MLGTCYKLNQYIGKPQTGGLSRHSELYLQGSMGRHLQIMEYTFVMNSIIYTVQGFLDFPLFLRSWFSTIYEICGII